MHEVTLRIRHRGEPESDISAQYPSLTVRSVSSLTGSTRERKRIHEIIGPESDIEAFVTEFRQAEKVHDMTLLSPPKNDHVFVAISLDGYQWDSIVQRLTNLGVYFRVGTSITAGWEHWTLFLDDGDDLAAIVENIEQAGNDVKLLRDVSLSDISGRDQLSISRIAKMLTERQREVLLVAVDLDYYGPSASASIEDIAKVVGIAPTTAWEHLARAEQKVMTEIGTSLDARARRGGRLVSDVHHRGRARNRCQSWRGRVENTYINISYLAILGQQGGYEQYLLELRRSHQLGATLSWLWYDSPSYLCLAL